MDAAFPIGEITQSIRTSIAAGDACFGYTITTNEGYRVQLLDAQDLVADVHGWPLVWVNHASKWDGLPNHVIAQLCRRLKLNWQVSEDHVWHWDGNPVDEPQNVCPECNGSGLTHGWEALDDGLTFGCDNCNGTGTVS